MVKIPPVMEFYGAQVPRGAEYLIAAAFAEGVILLGFVVHNQKMLLTGLFTGIEYW